MDAIILAAGENVRLQAAGLAPGKKPLLIRDGEVMLRRLARQARVLGASRIIVVASPSNAEDVAYAVTKYDARVVLQTEARGPTQAVDLGLELVQDEHCMLLMGDNYIPNDTCQDIRRLTGPRMPNWVVTTRSSDHALHAINDEGKFTRTESMTRWLGPLQFTVCNWVPHAGSWTEAFVATPFAIIDAEGIQDIGTL